MNDSTSTADAFERALLGAFTLLLTVTTTFMPKTYVPDRWMVAGWTSLGAGLTLVLAAHFVNQCGLRRTRQAVHAAAALCLVLGVAMTIVFVSEGEPDDGGDDTYASALVPSATRRQ